MAEYGITEQQVRQALTDPDTSVDGHSGRTIAQRQENGKVLRVIYEQTGDIKTVVTTYRAEADRYDV